MKRLASNETIFRNFRRGQKTILLLLVLLLPMGCSTGTLKKDKELTALLSDLSKRNEALEAKKREERANAFRVFLVTRSAAGVSVTLDLVDAQADVAFMRLMSESGTPFRMGDTTLPGRVTVKAEGVPLLEAAAMITAPLGIKPHMRGDTLFLNYAPAPQPASEEGEGLSVTRSFVLKNMSPDSGYNLLDTLFPSPRSLNFAKVPDSRSIYMSGPEGAVQKAIDLLMRADRDPGAVQIEALIVTVNSNAYEEFNAQFTGITKGRISAGKMNPWALTETSVDFTYNQNPALKNPLAFSALINMLFQQQKARIIARPFITAMSGEEADMNIGQKRYVVVQQPASGAPVYGMQSIEDGVGLKITPTVLGDNMVRMTIEMSNKQFVPTQGNIDQVVDDSSAKTILTLENGQTAIIGGLKMKSMATANAGIPWLRRIPILNLLTAAHQEDQSGQEVFFYLTPHIIKPGMAGPVDRPEAFAIDNSLLTPVEKFQR